MQTQNFYQILLLDELPQEKEAAREASMNSKEKFACPFFGEKGVEGGANPVIDRHCGEQ